MVIAVETSAAQALARGESFAGALDVGSLERLQDLVPLDGTQLQVSLHARVDAAGQGWLEGSLAGKLKAECRTCLRDFDWGFDLAVKLLLVHSEEEEELALERSEPYLVRNDRLMLHSLIEDEVLLALPMLPQCTACENARPAGEVSTETKKPSPLAALKNLKF